MMVLLLFAWTTVRAAEPMVYVSPKTMEKVERFSGLEAMRLLDTGKENYVLECRAVVLDPESGKLKGKK